MSFWGAAEESRPFAEFILSEAEGLRVTLTEGVSQFS
jgi:hypothetical protein